MTKSKANPTLPMFCSNCVSFFFLIFFSFVSSILQNCQKEFEIKKKSCLVFLVPWNFHMPWSMSRAMLGKPHPSLYLLPLLFLHFKGKHYVLVKSFYYIWKKNMTWKITKCVEMTLGIQKVVKLKIGEAYKEGDKSWRIKKLPFQIGNIRLIFFMKQTKENTYKHCSQYIWNSWIPTWFVGVTIFRNWKK